MPTGGPSAPATSTGAHAPTYQVQVDLSPNESPRLRWRRNRYWWRYLGYHAPAANCVPPLPTGMVSYHSSLESELMSLINSARTAAGAPALVLDDKAEIRSAARAHSYDVSGQDSPGNTGTDGSSPGDRLLRYCVGYRNYGESAIRVARDGATAASILQSFMDDAGSKANLLNSIYTQVGIGIYATQPPRRSYYVTIDLVQP